jgi:hypothetical protein
MRPVGVVPGENRLPALVLAGTGIDLPLAIELLPHPGGPPVRAVLERALVQAGSGEAGQHAYRARFRLRDLDSTALDIDLPAPVGEAGLRAYASVSGQTVELTPIPIDETGRPTASSSGARAVRLVVPPGDPLILDLRYKLSVGRPGNASERGLAEWSFAPPVPRRVLPFGPVRWQIFLPPGLVPLEFTGRMASEVRWTWRSAGLVPIPAYTTAELDRWLATGEEPGAEPPPSGEPMLVARQASLAPLRLAVVPTNVWRLGCSLAVVLLGLGLAYAWTWRWGGWLAVGSATAGVIVVTFLWPQPAVQFVGAMQPGLLVLAVGLGFMAAVSSWGWWRTGRAMRGFSRSPMGSSLIRPASPARRREPSTVDAPRPANGGLPIET